MASGSFPGFDLLKMPAAGLAPARRGAGGVRYSARAAF